MNRADRRAAERERRRIETLVRHGKAQERDGQLRVLVFAAHFTRSRAGR